MSDNEAYMIPGYDAPLTEISLKNFICDSPPKGILYRKNLRATIFKRTEAERGEPQFNPDHHRALKIENARARLAAQFENESYLIRSELKRLQLDNSTAAKSIVTEFVHGRIDTLWISSAADYAALCTLSYLNGVAWTSANTSKSFEIAGEVLQAGFEQMIRFSIEEFVRQNGSFKERVTAVVDAWDTKISVLADEVQRLFHSNRLRLGDTAHRTKIQAMLTGISLTGRDGYTYVCENSETSCSECKALSGQNFSISDAEEGVNLPPMHPNCRCTISGYPALSEPTTTIDILGLISEGVLQSVIDETVVQVSERVGGIANVIGAVWSHFVENSIEDYYSTFKTINIGGVEYHINRNSFTAVAIGPDGELIVPENAKPYDKQMLKLMRKRDELPEDSEERAEILAEIERLDKENDRSGEKLLSVNSDELYSFYVLGEDVTERLNEYMRQTEVNYAHMHNRPWVDNLRDFYLLVRGHGEMDLKNQPEWQQSAYIYDGELVSQDALGNINYGYFGTFCNIPKMVLIAAGGFAQWRSSREVNLEFWYTINDDPRDTFRVLQGIDIYNLWH